MLRAGTVLTFDEVEQLNDMESGGQLSTWLDAKVSCPTREAKRKLLHVFFDWRAKRRAWSKPKTKTAWCPEYGISGGIELSTRLQLKSCF